MTERCKQNILCVICFLLLIFSTSLVEEICKFFKVKVPEMMGVVKWLSFIALSLWQALRFVGRKTTAKLPDNICEITKGIGKSKKIIYIQPNEYADSETARCRLALRLSRWRPRWWKKSYDVVVVYSARSCGRRETVCRAIPDNMYPLYHIKYENRLNPFKNVGDIIIDFVKGKTFRYPTFLITLEQMLTPGDIRKLHDEGEKLCETMKDVSVFARLIFICTCNETLENIDWAFQFEPLNSTESDLFLEKASAAIEKASAAISIKNENSYDIVKNFYAGHHLKAAENFARGNPKELFHFVEIIFSKGNDKGNDLSPLNSVQDVWQKRLKKRMLNEKDNKAKAKAELFQKRILAVLHLLIAFYREDVEKVPLYKLVKCMFTDLNVDDVKNELGELLGVRDVSLKPFETKDISLPDFFCDEFLFSCGRFDNVPFHNEWQHVVDCLFTHSDLKGEDYAETYCNAMVNATIRCKLTHALPFQRRPSQPYQIIKMILDVVFTGESKTDSERREQICNRLRRRSEESFINFLADRLDILDAEEVFVMISEDINEYARNSCEWISRTLSYVSFLFEVEPDPLLWLYFPSEGMNTNELQPLYFLDVLCERINEIIASDNVSSQDVDNALVLCRMLQVSLNSDCRRVCSFTSESQLNAFFEEVQTSLNTRCSEKLQNTFKTVADFNGTAEDIESLSNMLIDSFDIAYTSCLFLLICRKIGQNKEWESLLECLALSIRKKITDNGNRRIPAAFNLMLRQIEFTIAWQRTVGIIPENPTPKDIKSLFPRLRTAMDKICANYNIDAENTPAFLVEVVAVVVSLQARFQDDQSYNESFQISWKQLNDAIHERFYTFTERDWFNFIKVVQGQTPFLSQQIREQYIKLWQAALEKIRASGSGCIQIAMLELEMFLSSSPHVWVDKEWGKTNQGPLIDLSMQSPFPFFIKEVWKVLWMQCVYAPVICANPLAIIERMFRVSGAECTTGDNCTAWNFSGISKSIQSGLASSVCLALQNAERNTFVSIKLWDETNRKNYFSWWIETANTILLPYLTFLENSGEDILEIKSMVLGATTNLFSELEKVIKKVGVSSEKISSAVNLVKDSLERVGQEFFLANADTIWNKILQGRGEFKVVSLLQLLLENIENWIREPQGTLVAICKIAQVIPQILESIDESFEDEVEEKESIDNILESLYQKIQELYKKLTKEALVRGGQNWYDDLMKAFARSKVFGIVSSELAEDAKNMFLLKKK